MSDDNDEKLSKRDANDLHLPARTHSAPIRVRTIHSINPLGMRVLVRVSKNHDVTEGGLYLPEGAKDSMAESYLAEVIEVASAIDDETHEEANVSGIPLGAHVLVPKGVGVKVPWDDCLRIVETKDVLAIVEKMSLT